MLIDINLLPQKEERNKTLLMFFFIGGLVFIVGLSAFFGINHTLNNKKASLDQQISLTTQLVQVQQEKIVAFEASNSVAELENTVRWATEYPIKAIPVLDKLTALLPERGFIQDFSYTETGEVQITVQFDESREAAFYLNSLLDSDWVADARLGNLQAETTIPSALTEEEEILLPNEKFVPRYMGNYTITLDRSIIKSEVTTGEEGDRQ